MTQGDYEAMVAAEDWTPSGDSMPDIGEFVLAWDSRRKLAAIAKWTGMRWQASGFGLKKSDVTFWSRINAPEAVDMKTRTSSGIDYTKADSQDNTTRTTRT